MHFTYPSAEMTYTTPGFAIAPRAMPSQVFRTAFTLVELLAVIAIIGLLVGLLVPALQSARETSRRSQCANNLRQIAHAMLGFERSMGRFPAGRQGCDDYDSASTDPVKCPGRDWWPTGSPKRAFNPQRPATSGFVQILPYLDQQALSDSLATSFSAGGLWPVGDDTGCNAAWRTSSALAAIATRPAVLVCPTDTSGPTITDATILNFTTVSQAAVGSYVLSQGTMGPDQANSEWMKMFNNGVFVYYIQRPLAKVLDGSSNTFLGGESINNDKPATRNIWTYAFRYVDSMRSTTCPPNSSLYPSGCPYSYGGSYGDFASMHPGGVNFAFVDGHTQFISDTISLTVYKALSTIAGNETVDLSGL